MKKLLSENKVDILIVLLVTSLALFIFLNISVLHVQGDSMYPTFNNKDNLVVKKSKRLKRDNIIVFHPNSTWSQSERKFIKRIVALEGDEIEVNNDSLKINGNKVLNIKTKECHIELPKKVIIDTGEIFVVGDNYNSSNDSLTQLCNGNEDFLVSEKMVILNGKEIFKFGGF